MNNLFRTIEDLIRHGKTENLKTKIEVFYKAGTLSEEEYKKLLESLPSDYSEE